MLLPLAGFSPVQAQNPEGETKPFNISSIDAEITINRFGDRDPQGKMYVLEAGSDANGNGQDDAIDAVRAQEVAPLPDPAALAPSPTIGPAPAPAPSPEAPPEGTNRGLIGGLIGAAVVIAIAALL